MSSSGLDLDGEDESGSILVDWGEQTTTTTTTTTGAGLDTSSSRSFSHRGSARLLEANAAMSLYDDSDSSSSDEFRKRSAPRRMMEQRQLSGTMSESARALQSSKLSSAMAPVGARSTSLFRGLMGTGTKDAEGEEGTPSFDMASDDGADDDVMILSDFEDEESNHLGRERLGQMNFAPLSSSDSLPQQPSSSTPLSSRRNKERQELNALFAEDKPWRKDNRSILRKKTRPLPQEQRMPSLTSSDNEVAVDFLNAGLPSTPIESTQREQNNDDDDESTDSEDEPIDDAQSGDSASTIASGLSAIELDDDGIDDFEEIPFIPNSFIGDGKLHPSMATFLDDPILNDKITKKEANFFVTEHRLLVRALLQLMWDRDRAAGSTGFDNIDSSTILKQGPLKKFHTSVGRPTWKVKYVEVRRAVLSYYEDHDKRRGPNRSDGRPKMILLRDCVCKEVNEFKGAMTGYVMELSSPKQPTRLWMANSEEERQSWMKAIQDAGKKSDDAENNVDLTPFQVSVQQYQHLKSNLWISQRKKDYMNFMEPFFTVDMVVPTKWQQARDSKQELNGSVADFYKFLSKTTVQINGNSIPAGSEYSAERVLGSFSRCILEYDRSSEEEHAQEDNISELQSIAFSRDVLLSVWKSRSKDDSHYIVDNLCENKSLVICLPYEQDPVQLGVSYTTAESLLESTAALGSDTQLAELSGWVSTRSKSNKPWKDRFFIISDGVLTYYQHSTPRPHGLRGQIVLEGASVSTLDDKHPNDAHLFILKLEASLDESFGQQRERQLSFRDPTVCKTWRESLQKAIDSSKTAPHTSPRTAARRKRALNPASRIVKNVKGAREGGMKAIKGGADLVLRGFKKGRSNGSNHDGDKFETGKIQNPTVQVVLDACSYYKIITADPSGLEKEDTWLTVRAKISQLYFLSGGPNGSCKKLDDVVTLSFREGLVKPGDFGEIAS